MIRRAQTRKEIEALLPLARAFFKIVRPGEELNEEWWVNYWSAAISGDRTAVLFQLDDSGAIVGMISGVIARSHLDGSLEAKEAWWFVEEASRRDGIELLDAIEGWAEECGAKRFWMVRLEGWRERALDGLYRRRGYEPVERAFCKEMNHGT